MESPSSVFLKHSYFCVLKKEKEVTLTRLLVVYDYVDGCSCTNRTSASALIFHDNDNLTLNSSFEVGSMGREGLRDQGLPQDKNIRSN
jgi:hypothetical protein